MSIYLDPLSCKTEKFLVDLYYSIEKASVLTRYEKNQFESELNLIIPKISVGNRIHAKQILNLIKTKTIIF